MFILHHENVLLMLIYFLTPNMVKVKNKNFLRYSPYQHWEECFEQRDAKWRCRHAWCGRPVLRQARSDSGSVLPLGSARPWLYSPPNSWLWHHRCGDRKQYPVLGPCVHPPLADSFPHGQSEIFSIKKIEILFH